MYTYKFVKTPWFCSYYSKYLRKPLLIQTVIIIFLLDLFIYTLLSIYLIKSNIFNGAIFLSLLAITILLEGILLIIYCNKTIKTALTNMREDEFKISFDENGITLTSEGLMRHINWKSVSDANATKEDLRFFYKVNGISHTMLIFSFFDTPKEAILADIEQYISVRRLNNNEI